LFASASIDHAQTVAESAIEGARSAESADDLPAVPATDYEEAAPDAETEEIVFEGEASFDEVGEDVDLTGREPIRFSDEERRERNRRAVEIITNKNPVQITDQDRETLIGYTGAGGLGSDTGTGTQEGERDEHYTDYLLIEAMWSMMENVGAAEGNVLEPGAGIGNFAGLRPSDHAGRMVMVEKSPTTADICRALYPEQDVLNQSLSVVDLGPYQLQGAVGNVPFGSKSIHASSDPVVEGVDARVRIHDYFILRAIEAVDPGGVVALITSTTTADRQNANVRRRMVEEAFFLGGFRLPSSAFAEHASTQVTTDLLVFQKRPEGLGADDVPEAVETRSLQFASKPIEREAVLRTDRTEPTDDEMKLVSRLREARERIGHLQERKTDLDAKIDSLYDEMLGASYSERADLRSKRSDLREERDEVVEEKERADERLAELKERFDDSAVVEASAPINPYFDENPDQVLGELRHGYNRPTMSLFGVEGEFGQDELEQIADFAPTLATDPPEPKELYRAGTGQALGIDREVPAGALVHKDGAFYEKQAVGYGQVSPEHPEVTKSAVEVLRAYDLFTTALAREASNTEALRRALQEKLQQHVRSYGLPSDDERLMDEDLKYDPRRPTLASLAETNEAGRVSFADVLSRETWYNGGQYRARIGDDENLASLAEFLRAQGEAMTAESFANFYKGGALGREAVEEMLAESGDFYFVPQVGSTMVEDLSEEIIEHVDEEEGLMDGVDQQTGVGSAPASDPETVLASKAADSYAARRGEWRYKLSFLSGEMYGKVDLYEAMLPAVDTDEMAEELRATAEDLREARPEQKDYVKISLDPRMIRSWLPEEVVQEWIRYELGYQTELEFVDAPKDPDSRRVILRYKNGTYIQSSSDSNLTLEDEEKGWHGIPYSYILRRYMRLQRFPLKYGNQYYVDPETREPLYDVTSKDDARDEGVLKENKKIQASNETKMKNEIPRDFEQWADQEASEEIRERIQEAYNRAYRSTAQPEFTGETLNLKGFNFPEDIFRHNRRVAEKMVYNQKGGDNHAVGAGKAQPLDATVMTPEGPTQMGEIERGDMVMGEDGTPTEVTGVFPQGKMDIFEITFSDGSTTRCTRDHLWLTQTQTERDYASKMGAQNKDWDCAKPELRTTGQIMETMESRHGGPNHTIPITEPVEFNESMVTVDPYVLGALIGDGMMHSRRIVLSTADEEIVEEVRAATPERIMLNDTEEREDACPSYTLRTVDDSTGSANPLMREIKALGLYGKRSGGKFIPERYLYGSVEQRTALLQGLMDTDGEVDHKGTSVYFTTVSEKLAGQVQTLVQSLGGTAVMNEKVPRYTHDGEVRTGQTSYRLTLRLPPEINIFRLDRKAESRQPKTRYPARRGITDIEKVGHEEAQCIRVASASSLYLTDDFVCTHNTFAAIIAIETLRNRGQVSKPMFVVPSQVIEKWMDEYQTLFPDRTVLQLGGKQEGLREELQRAQLFDYDSIFITQTGWKRVEINPTTQKRLLKKRKQETWEMLEELEDDLGDRFPKDEWEPIIKGLKNEIEDWEEEINEINEQLQEQSADTGIYLDETGVDCFVLDEAHAYKNARAPSQQAAELGIAKSKGEVSARAEAAKKKVDWLHWTLGDDVNSFILTATPIENSPLEIWHMLQLCAPSVLEKYDIESLDAFIDLFVQIEEQVRRKTDGRFTVESVVTSYKNVQELQRVLSEVLDIKSYERLMRSYEQNPVTDEDGNEIQPFSRPDKTVEHTELKPSAIHEHLLEDVKMRADIMRAMLACDAPPISDNFLSLTSDGGTLAEDLRLYQPAFWGYEGPGLKIEALTEKVVEEYRRPGLPLDADGEVIRANPRQRLGPRDNPRVVHDKFDAPVGYRRGGVDSNGAGRGGAGETRENPARENAAQENAARENAAEVGKEVSSGGEGAGPGREAYEEGAEIEGTDGTLETVAAEAPRNQIIFTSSASMKGGPYLGSDPLELPYAADAKPYHQLDGGEAIKTKDPALAEPDEEIQYVQFESASWLRYIKDKIVEQGIPEHKVAIVSGTVIGLEEGPNGQVRDHFVESDEDKNKLKQQVQERFQNGEINVIIGTNAISEGMNLDKWTTRIYHLDIPWKPSRVEQRNGRGLRQGNKYPEIQIDFLLLERSFDSYRLQLVKQKQDWIDSVLHSDQNRVQTAEGGSSGDSQALPYQEMMVATSEDDSVQEFFEAKKTLDRTKPKVNRLENEVKAARRKRRQAEQDLESLRENLQEVRRAEAENVEGAEVPATAWDALDSGQIEIRHLRHSGARGFRATVRVSITDEKRFKFETREGGDPKSLAFQKKRRAPDAWIEMVWGETDDAGLYKQGRKTYFRRRLQSKVADQNDWLGVHEQEVRDYYRTKRLEAAREKADDPSEVTTDDIDPLPDELTVEALYSENDKSYRDTKKEIGLVRDGRLGIDEWAAHWMEVMRKGLAEEFLERERRYVERSDVRIKQAEGNVEAKASRVEDLAKQIDEGSSDLQKLRAKREQAQEDVTRLSSAANQAMDRPFRTREDLYVALNEVRSDYGIVPPIPRRTVGALYGNELVGGEEEGPPDEADPDKEVVELDDPEDEQPTLIDIDAPDVLMLCNASTVLKYLPSLQEGGADGGASDGGAPDDGASGADAEPRPGPEEDPSVGGAPGQESAPGQEDAPGQESAQAQEGASEPAGDAAPGGAPSGSPVYPSTYGGTPIIEDAAKFASLLKEEYVDVPPDLQNGSFDGDAQWTGRVRALISESYSGFFAPAWSPMYSVLSAPTPNIENEDTEGLAVRVAAHKEGYYADKEVLVPPPFGEEAFDLWREGYVARQVAGGQAESAQAAQSRLEALREEREVDVDMADLMPGQEGVKASSKGIVVPNGAELTGAAGSAHGLLEAYAVIDVIGERQVAGTDDAGRAEQFLYVPVDWIEFVMQAISWDSTISKWEAVDLRLIADKEDAQYSPPALQFWTDAGAVACALTVGAYEAGVRDKHLPETLPPARHNPGGEPVGQSSPVGQGEPVGQGYPIGQGYVRTNPDPSAVADVDTDHALGYVAKTRPGSFVIEGPKRSFRATEEEVHHLFADPEGSLILVVPASRIEPADVPPGTGEDAEDFFEEFHHYEADGESMILDLPPSDPDRAAEHVGHADEILYSSDKKMRAGDREGEAHDYIHEFDEGQRPVYRWDDVWIIDEVAIDGRGILN